MHLTEVSIRNIRSIRSLRWRLPEGKTAGWHVILGENGSGKTAFLRCASVALLGGRDVDLLLGAWWDTWLRRAAKEGNVDARAVGHEGSDPSSGQKGLIELGFKLFRQSSYVIGCDPVPPAWDTDSKAGWFSAGYGPFRRFTGGDPESQERWAKLPRCARHISLFEARIALTDSLRWLNELDYRRLEEETNRRTNGSSTHDGKTRTFLRRIRELINRRGFLPHGTKLSDISSDGVRFRDGNGAEIDINELSDGYRSILSLTLDLLRHLAEAFGSDALFTDDGKIAAYCVVLIDEIDAHLHPTWQREVGVWFKRWFPNMQFIVTTHSPIVCQAATSVFVLPRPGSEEKGRMLKGIELDRLRYGNVLDAYSTGAFGWGVTRSAKSERMLDRLAVLNLKELEEGLSPEEQREQQRLRAILPTTAPILHEAEHHGDT